MPLSKLVFKPGISRDQTNYASEGGWYACDKVRFRSGFPEKIGGWRVSSINEYIGTARSLFSWSGENGVELVGVGTNEKIYVGAGGTLYDITPLRATYTTSSTPQDTDNCFATTINTTTVTVTITSHGASEGDWVTFSGATGPVGGVPASDLNQEFKISNVTANTFQITVDTTATSTVASGGGTAIVAEFQVSIGNATLTAGYGWGTGTYSRGGWGSGSTSPIYQPARLVYQDNYFGDLYFNISGGDIYYWAYNVSFPRAVKLSSVGGAVAVPQQVTKIQFASTGHLMAFGCTEYDAASPPGYVGSLNPMIIRWADVDADVGPKPEVWQPTVSNSAGWLYLKNGSRIITSMRTRQEMLVWTDTSVYSVQFLGTEEVFGQQELASHTTIIGPNVVVGANNLAFWMGSDKFYTYSGRVETLPCTLRQYVFADVNRSLGSLFFAGSNNQFNEIIWFYCSANASEIDRYVIYNYADNVWYYGQIARTAWLEAGPTNYPLAANNGWIYAHELGQDDGQPNGAAPLPIEAYIQSADVDIDDGDKFMLLRRLIPDVNFTGSATSNYVTGATITPEATVTVGVRNFPGAMSDTTNVEGQSLAKQIITEAVIDQYTNQVFVRGRGRQMNFRISSDTVGTQWQLGMPRIDARPDGSKS